MVALTASLSAQVSLPFYDGFDYTAGGNLAGNGSWVSAATTIKVNAGNLSYPGLQLPVGNDVTIIPTTSAARTYVNFASQTSGTVYFSFLLRVVAAPSGNRLIAYAFNSTSSSTSPYLGMFITSGGQLAVGISTSSPQFTGSGLTVGNTNLVVIGYTFGATDSAQIWINPTNFGGSAPVATGSFNASGHNSALSYFHWNTPGTSSSGSYVVDELRIATNWAGVTPAGTPPPDPPPAMPPTITNAFMTADGFVLRGAGGNSNGTYHVRATTDIIAPVESWDVIGTYGFDAFGRFSCTNPVAAGVDNVFYCLQIAGTLPIAPHITGQPQHQVIVAGQNAAFSVIADGAQPLAYQWFKSPSTALSGEAAAALSIPGAQTNDAGGYFVIISNSIGSVTSIVATLTVQPSPTNGAYYVAPEGSDSNSGSIAAPFYNLSRAISLAVPGDTIYMRGGTYYYSQTIRVEKSGTANNRINIWAFPGEQPILDFVNQPYGSSYRGILFTTNGNYWDVRGLEVTRAGDNAIKVEGSYLRFEQCVLHHNGDTGLQIGFGHPAVNNINLAAFVEVINCDSYSNFDPDSNGGDADGFAAKLHCGQGIVFMGCRAWENSDDGWDLFETDASIVISNCWTWKSGVGQGNGNGFKLGGDGAGGQSKGTHYAYNCVAFGHKVNGFTQNSHRDGLVVINCLSFTNGPSGYNYFMEGNLNSGKTNIFKNNVGIRRNPASSSNNFIADNNPVEQNNSWNLAVTANYADYVSLLESAAKAPRQADGSLPTGFARLVAGSDLIDKGVNVGQPFNGTAPDLGPYEYAP